MTITFDRALEHLRSKADGCPRAEATYREPAGDFSLVARPDGLKQWAYKGRGLYTYAHDLAPNDADGGAVDKRRAAAAVYAFFMLRACAVKEL